MKMIDIILNLDKLNNEELKSRKLKKIILELNNLYIQECLRVNKEDQELNKMLSDLEQEHKNR